MAVRPLQVCLVTGEYPPDEGGVADYSACLASALVELGVIVEVVTTRRGAGKGERKGGAGGQAGAGGSAGVGGTPVVGGMAGSDGDQRTEEDLGAERGSGSHHHPAVHRSVSGWGFGCLREVGRAIDLAEPDIVHFQYQAAAYELRAAIHGLPLWLRLTRQTRVAVTYHDLRVPYLAPKAGPLRGAAVRLLARHADLTIATNSEDYSELAVERYPGRLEVVPIGSNIPDAPPAGFDRGAWREAAGIARDSVLLAYFGFLNASKGGRVLVDTLGTLRRSGSDARLVMIGGAVGASDPTNRGYLAQFRADLAAAGLADAVIWTGHLQSDKVSAWLRAADVVVLPYQDGASYRRGSLLAALAHGRPVVTTTPAPLTGGILPPLVDGEALRLVPPGDAAALASAVRAIAGDPDLAERLASGARTLAVHFTWRAIAARHLALYRSVLAET